MNRFARKTLVVMMFFLALAACSMNSGRVNGGGTIVGNPSIPYYPQTTEDKQLADTISETPELHWLLQAGLFEWFGPVWPDKLQHCSTILPSTTSATETIE